MKYMGIKDFLGLDDLPLVDVRAPAEFTAGHIPGAVSIPLFNDSERAEIGTAYKQTSTEAAIRLGLVHAGRNMQRYISETESLKAKRIRIHCWRGGMRSESMAWVLDKLTEETYVLEGGYKAYRKHLHEFFAQPLPLKIITGNTGSGKTRILHELEKQGQQVVDLEGLANHQGSSFGNLKTPGQPPTEHYQNLLFETFRKHDLAQPVWIEDESFCIGGACMPEELFEQLRTAPRYLIRVSRERRVENLVSEYGKIKRDLLIRATEGIRKKLGKEETAQITEFIKNGDLREAATLLLFYYDKRYNKSFSKNAETVVADTDFHNASIPEIATNLIQQVNVS